MQYLNYGLYTRKSDDDKTVTEKSIKDQLAELKPIQVRDNLVVVKIWKESKSAKIPHVRPDYSEMIGMIIRGEINAILCWHINRLIRNMDEGGTLVHLFATGVIKEIRTPSAVYRTGDNILPLVIEAASATQFSIDHTRNVNRGMASKFKSGGCNYKAPQGYLNARHPLNPDIGIVIHDPQRYDLMRKAWDMFLTGAYTPPQVIRTLNDVWGYRIRATKKLPSRPISEGHSYKLFANPMYAGYVKEKGKLVRCLEIETPMVTLDEFSRAQELLKKDKARQAYHKHEHAFTGLMTCGYCGQGITAEKVPISTGAIWENYHCSNNGNKCTARGMALAKVEKAIINALEGITIDADLCQIALNNIVRDLDGQTSKVQTLYNQQNSTLADVEERLSNLADMWISGMMRDEKMYKDKEATLLKQRNDLLTKGKDCRDELDKMRANAMAASNYIVFARDNFMLAKDDRKREIAHSLGFTYKFYGREKKIEVEIHPLLIEVVSFAKQVEKALELEITGYTKEKTGSLQPALSSGGP